MNTIVDKLLDVDKEARKKLDEAQEFYETTISDTKKEMEKMKKEYDEQLQHYIREISQNFEDDANQEIAGIEEKKAAQVQKMNSVFEAHKQQWQDTIFARCIARM